jgi:hypothetical protein
MKGFFADEILRHEGLGDCLREPACAHCKTALTSADGMPTAESRAFKCYECGAFLQCKSCCLAHHARTPLHVLQVKWLSRCCFEVNDE